MRPDEHDTNPQRPQRRSRSLAPGSRRSWTPYRTKVRIRSLRRAGLRSTCRLGVQQNDAGLRWPGPERSTANARSRSQPCQREPHQAGSPELHHVEERAGERRRLPAADLLVGSPAGNVSALRGCVGHSPHPDVPSPVPAGPRTNYVCTVSSNGGDQHGRASSPLLRGVAFADCSRGPTVASQGSSWRGGFRKRRQGGSTG
jgi:hypothetical protein